MKKKKTTRNPHVVIVSFSQGYSNSRSVINKTTLLHVTKHRSVHSMKNKTITQRLINIGRTTVHKRINIKTQVKQFKCYSSSKHSNIVNFTFIL